MRRRRWNDLLPTAYELAVAETENVGVPPSVRRLHYLLLGDERAKAWGYRNVQNDYKDLCEHTAQWRRDGYFPDLSDHNRRINAGDGFKDTHSALEALADQYRIDRRQYMDSRVVVVAEKAGLVPLLELRFGWMDVTSTSGYTSLTHGQRLSRFDHAVYVGDFDPSGLDISRDLARYVEVHRVALTLDQIDTYDLPPLPAKKDDARTASMAETHGQAFQVEVDTLDRDVMRAAVAARVSELSGLELDDEYFPVLPDVDEQEADDLARLTEMAESLA